MAKGILGKKIGMTQLFTEHGEVIPITVIEAGPCFVSQKKTVERDGYEAVQLSFDVKREKHVTNPEKGHAAKASVKPCKFVREFKFDDASALELGQEIKADLFAEGDMVDVVGISKGKGFTGMIKFGFSRGPMGHGSKYHRRVGSLGAKGPARVFKGRPLPGRKGNDRVTIQNLQIVKVDQERNLLLIKGSVPGAKKSYLMVKQAVKSK